MKKNNFFNYLKRLSSKWWVLLAIIPSIFGAFNFYLHLPEIIISWQFSLIIFLVLFFIANYLIWEEGIKEKKDLQNKIDEYENKKPKLRLSFGGNRNIFLLKNKVFERELEEPSMRIRPINPNVLQRLINISGFTKNPIIDELHEAFLPLKFELHNEGDFKATNVRIDIYFPKNLILIQDLPQQNNLISPVSIRNLHQRRTYGGGFQEKDHLRLWSDKSLHPDYIEFDTIYVFSDEEKKFKVKYEIHAEELDSKGIEGELTINAKPIKETKTYTIKGELEQDKNEYEEILKHHLETI